MISDEDVKALHESLKSVKSFLAVGVGAGELIIYATNTKHDFPKMWKGHLVRVVKTSKPRPANA